MNAKIAAAYKTYEGYLLSHEWDVRRKATLRRAWYRCERCGARNTVLQVHHITYERIGNELGADLIALCESCHMVRHAKRRVVYTAPPIAADVKKCLICKGAGTAESFAGFGRGGTKTTMSMCKRCHGTGRHAEPSDAETFDWGY